MFKKITSIYIFFVLTLILYSILSNIYNYLNSTSGKFYYTFGDFLQLIISMNLLALLLIPAFLFYLYIFEKMGVALVKWPSRLAVNRDVFFVLLYSLLVFFSSITPTGSLYSATYRGCQTHVNGEVTSCGMSSALLDIILILTSSMIVYFLRLGCRKKWGFN